MIMLDYVSSFASKWQESGENVINRYLSSKSEWKNGRYIGTVPHHNTWEGMC